MRRPPYTSGDPEIDARLRELVEGLDQVDAQLVFEMLATAIRLAKDPITRLDRKIAASALKEMRYAFSVFAPYSNVRKVTMFGSARTGKDDPAYDIARRFAHQIVQGDWMVVTGAGPGIMEAGHEGAGGEKSFGVNIILPFEAKPNPVIAGDPKLINFKYFFTRKLMFMKESDAFVLLPGGFGTLDETFELLCLVQTGKSDLHPIVMLDIPDGSYWRFFERYIKEELLSAGFINPDDLSLFKITDDIDVAVDEIKSFYGVYHSQRYVGGRLILRLNQMPADSQLQALSDEFAGILDGPIEKVDVSAPELRDHDAVELPRIALAFDRVHYGRLRLLVDRLNSFNA